MAKPSTKVCRYFDDGRMGMPLFSHEISHSDDNTEQVNLQEDEFSVIVRSLIGVAKMGRSSEGFES